MPTERVLKALTGYPAANAIAVLSDTAGAVAVFLQNHYFESQSSLCCGWDALNNALGDDVFANNDLTAAGAPFKSESLIPSHEGGLVSAERWQGHVGPGGNYSVEIMSQALRRAFQYELVLRPLKGNMNYIYDP